MIDRLRDWADTLRIRPRVSVRLRLTLTYAALFALASLVLLLLSYGLVRANLQGLPVRPGAFLRALGGPQVGSPQVGSTPVPREALPPKLVVSGVRDALASRSLHRLELQFSAVFAATLVVSCIAGWWVAGRVLAPLRHITGTARRVSGETLSERIALGGPDDELRELADTFDGMLDRLQAAFASQQRFIANASHELRTPLTVIRTEVDVALSDPNATYAELQSTRGVVRRAVERSEQLIDGLLTLARSDGGHPPSREPVALDRRARDYLALAWERTAERGLTIDTTELRPASAGGDPELLGRVVENLIENAIRHNVDEGWIRIATDTRDGRACLHVANGGAAIADEDLDELIQPFRQLGRARTGEGSGLGLSIVDSVVRLHGGALRLSNPAAGGLAVNVELPSAAPAERQGSAHPAPGPELPRAPRTTGT